MMLTLIAIPYISEEIEATVGVEFGTLLVLVSLISILSTGIERHAEQTCTILVCNPYNYNYNNIIILIEHRNTPVPFQFLHVPTKQIHLYKYELELLPGFELQILHPIRIVWA